MSDRIGLYGGSFDPPHRAHTELVRQALETGQIDRVIVVPVYEHALNKRTTGFAERLRLSQLAFSSLERADVSSIEEELPRPSYTLHTLQALAERFPGATFRLLVGADVLADLPRWHRIEEVLRLAPLLLFGRSGVEESAAPPVKLPEISSTEVRRALIRRDAEDQKHLEEWLDPQVLREIDRCGLYST